MWNLGKGILAGLSATTVLSLFMVMKQKMGLMPELDPIGMLTHMFGASTPIAGWIIHVMIGVVVWGGLFALIQNRLPGGAILSGILFGAGAWLLMMVMVMPMAGAGLFGLKIGMAAPAMTLMLHIIFGTVLGMIYAGLSHPGRSRSKSRVRAA